MSWIAEDVPWYQVSRASRSELMSDEDYAMSAPRRLGEFATADEARARLAEDLEQSSNYGYIIRGGEGGKFLAAAAAIEAGVDGVKVHGRYYRVREVRP